MAGDWIPMRLDLAEDPAVLAMADELENSEEYVVGCLHKVWSWASRQCHDGSVTNVTLDRLKRVTHLSEFIDAMLKTGWLEVDTDQYVVFPKWDRWLSKSAKTRLLAAKRKASQRAAEAEKCHARSVTKTGPQERRGEKSINPLIYSPPTDHSAAPASARTIRASRFVPPTVADVAAYCLERRNDIDANLFVSHYEANGWRVGRNPMVNWQAAVRTWEKNGWSTQTGKGPRKVTQI